MPTVNQDLHNISVFYTKNITEGIKQDKSVINLARGDSEFQTPMSVLDYLARILPEEGESTADINKPAGKWTHYEKVQGSSRLREAIARKYKKESDLEIDPDCILITQGGMNAIYTAFLSITNPGDHILIPDPCYVAYDPIANHILRGLCGVRINLRAEDGFNLTVDTVEAARTDRTKAVILTSPLNPAGSVMEPRQLKELMEWGIQNDIYIIHDENHEKEIYDGHKHIPIKCFDGDGNHSVLLNSFSRLGMGGWRLGWMVASREVIKAAALAHSFINMTCNTFVQEAGAYALDNYQDLGFHRHFLAYQEKRDFIVPGLNRLPGFHCSVPKGTCYAFPNVKQFYLSYRGAIMYELESALSSVDPGNQARQADLIKSVSYAVYQFLLRRAKVGVIPGLAYGPNSDDHIRLSFSVKKDALEESMNRLQHMFAQL